MSRMPLPYLIADVIVTGIGYVLGTAIMLISLAFAPFFWAWANVSHLFGGRK